MSILKITFNFLLTHFYPFEQMKSLKSVKAYVPVSGSMHSGQVYIVIVYIYAPPEIHNITYYQQ